MLANEIIKQRQTTLSFTIADFEFAVRQTLADRNVRDFNVEFEADCNKIRKRKYYGYGDFGLLSPLPYRTEILTWLKNEGFYIFQNDHRSNTFNASLYNDAPNCLHWHTYDI